MSALPFAPVAKINMMRALATLVYPELHEDLTHFPKYETGGADQCVIWLETGSRAAAG